MGGEFQLTLLLADVDSKMVYLGDPPPPFRDMLLCSKMPSYFMPQEKFPSIQALRSKIATNPGTDVEGITLLINALNGTVVIVLS